MIDWSNWDACKAAVFGQIDWYFEAMRRGEMKFDEFLSINSLHFGSLFGDWMVERMAANQEAKS